MRGGFTDSVVLDTVLPNPLKVDAEPPKRDGLGASAAGAAAGSAGLGCSLGCPKMKALAGDAGFAGASMLAGGANADASVASAALLGVPKLKALVVVAVASAGLAGAPKLNGEVDAVLATSAFAAGSVGLGPKRDVLVEGASLDFAWAPNATVAPVEAGCSAVLTGVLPKTEVDAVFDVALPSDLSSEAVEVPAAAPKGEWNKLVVLPEEPIFAPVGTVDEPNSDGLGASFCSGA